MTEAALPDKLLKVRIVAHDAALKVFAAARRVEALKKRSNSLDSTTANRVVTSAVNKVTKEVEFLAKIDNKAA